MMKKLSLTLTICVLAVLTASLAHANPDRWTREGWKTDFAQKSIAFDEILSGGIGRDVIPPIDKPVFKPVSEITHVKEAASSQSSKSRIDFYEAMWIFYRKHYQAQTSWLLDKAILFGIVGKGAMDTGKHFWRFCHSKDGETHASTSTSTKTPAATMQAQASGRDWGKG